MNKKNFISIIIPTYNSSRSILTTLHSVANQSYKDYEIIILDSCSSDGTTQAIKNFKRSIELNPNHLGSLKNRASAYAFDNEYLLL